MHACMQALRGPHLVAADVDVLAGEHVQDLRQDRLNEGEGVLPALRGGHTQRLSLRWRAAHKS